MDGKKDGVKLNPKVCFTADDYQRFEEESIESETTIVVPEKWYRKHKSVIERFKRQLFCGKDLKFVSGERVCHMPAKSSMTLNEFWEQNHMSNHTWGVTVGGRK